MNERLPSEEEMVGFAKQVRNILVKGIRPLGMSSLLSRT
jgi:hypothetical protein